jgi:hypothetical protein
MVSIVHSTDQSFVLKKVDAARKAEAEGARDQGDDFRDRMRVNLFGAAVLIALTLFGLWLVNTMVATEKAHGCYTSGEHTCSLI